MKRENLSEAIKINGKIKRLEEDTCNLETFRTQVNVMIKGESNLGFYISINNDQFDMRHSDIDGLQCLDAAIYFINCLISNKEKLIDDLVKQFDSL